MRGRPEAQRCRSIALSRRRLGHHNGRGQLLLNSSFAFHRAAQSLWQAPSYIKKPRKLNCILNPISDLRRRFTFLVLDFRHTRIRMLCYFYTLPSSILVLHIKGYLLLNRNVSINIQKLKSLFIYFYGWTRWS